MYRYIFLTQSYNILKRSSSFNKRKIINDPIYGFITIPDELLFDLIEHPYFQRLRRIKQLGLSHLIYPGALHTRFHHSLGAMHLMLQAIDTLRQKGEEITNEEKQASLIAILLHDMGHSPYSHTLENKIVFGISHEELSVLFMHRLNEIFEGKLSMAIKIFQNDYSKTFLHQLVSSQLDMDRLDFLKRDSFYTGVSEGVISTDRIIKMLDVVNDELAVEAKGIYSIEKFIVARRLMYWQVYLHKTVIAAEQLLNKILERARFLAQTRSNLFATPVLLKFLRMSYNKQDFYYNKSVLDSFSELDDYDIFASIKAWTKDEDTILSTLCNNLTLRHLPRIEIQTKPYDEAYIQQLKEKTARLYNLDLSLTDYFVYSDVITNKAYNPYSDRINILYKNNKVLDIAEASDQLNVAVLTETVSKYYLCYPKTLSS